MAPRYRKSKEQAASAYARQKLLRQRRRAAAATAPAPVPLRALPWYQSLNKWPISDLRPSSVVVRLLPFQASV
jgi:hypothetical protein